MKIVFTIGNDGLAELVALSRNFTKDVASIVYRTSFTITPAGPEGRYTRFSLYLEPAWPEIYKLGWIMLFIAFLISGVGGGWWSLMAFIPGFIVSSTQLFFWRRFYGFLFWLKFRRYGVVFTW